MPDDLLIPAGARLIHVGPQKTGTTAIQVAMASARDEMAVHSAYYPAGPYRRRKASWALGLPGAPRGRDFPIRHWDKLVAEVRDAGAARVCVSDENFARAEPAVIERIVTELGGPEVRVVAVARRLDRLLPSVWQERVKWGHAGDFETWLGRLLGDDPDDRERWDVWQGHEFVGLIERWTQFVDPDRFTLVIGDEADRGQLFRVFSDMLGLPPGVLKPDPSRSNTGLSWSELEVLRALRVMYVENGWPVDHFGEKLRPIVRALRSRTAQETGPRTPPIPAWARERIQELSEQRADAVATLPVRVVGDADTLRQVDEPTDEDVSAEDLTLPISLVTAVVEGVLRAEGTFEHPTEPSAPEPSAPEPVAPETREPSGRELVHLGIRKVRRRLTRR